MRFSLNIFNLIASTLDTIILNVYNSNITIVLNVFYVTRGENMKANKQNLKVAMARACMNRSDIAKVAEMPQPTVNNVIAGRNVKPATLGKVARALSVDVIDILEQQED